MAALPSCAPSGEPAASDRGGLSELLEGRARADVPLGSRGRPRPSIVWTPVKPVEPELVLAKSAGPPLSLTSSDGTGLQLVALEARAVVEDPLTFTELKLTFRNPQPRQLEGQFEITLPPDAAISRFAMRQGDAWQEGEVVELQAARQAYEDFLHRRQDPALLEKQAGNQFRARVFPIPPSGEKQLIISYSAERPRADAPYRIYLRGLPELARLDIRAIIAKSSTGSGQASSLGGETLSHQTVAVQKQNFRPDVDFEVPVPVPQAADSSAVGLRHQNLVVARISPLPADKQAQTDPLDSVLVLFDTSASRALGWQAQVDALGGLVDTLRKEAGPALPLRVLCFDQDVEPVFDGPAGQFGAAQLQRVRERRALGASDLARALRAAVAKKGAPMQRVLLITDGIVTAGATAAPELRKLVAALSGQGARRLDVITFGGIRDEALLAKLVTAGLPSDGVVLDGETPPQAVARRLQRSTFSGIKVEVLGSPWVWPVQLDGVQPGEQVLVYADLPDGKPFEVTLTDKDQRIERRPVVTVEVARPLLERAWVNARIHRLLNQRDKLAESDPDLGEALKHQIVDLSTKFRVLSDYTALLVLETEQDYARFRIDRRALTDILTIGLNGIEVVNRKNLAPVVVANPPPRIITQNATPKDRDGDSGSPVRSPRPTAGKAAAPTRPEPREAERNKRSASSAAAESGVSAADESSVSSARGGAPARSRAQGGEGGQDPGAPRRPLGRAPAPAAEPVATAAAPAPPPPPQQLRASIERPAEPKVPETRIAEKKKEESKPDRADDRAPRTKPTASSRPRPTDRVLAPVPVPDPPPPPPPPPPPEAEPYEGKLREVLGLVKAKRLKEALQLAQKWRDEDPGDVLALLALGEVFEALADKRAAARAYGSIIDLFPGRADLRRFAGARLERLSTDGLPLAIDTFDKARAQRADHPASHRLLAYAQLRAGRPAEALETILGGATRTYPSGRFAGVERILAEDVGLIAAAYVRAQPGQRSSVEQRLAGLGARIASEPSLRFVLTWETDANDVDFHIYDGRGGHAFYGSRSLPSGGELYADVTTGYGPECFTIPLPPGARTYPYKLQAHYYSRGPMGYGMGKLEVLEHDGKGGLRFSQRPFVIMVDSAFVNLGEVRSQLSE